jgi:prefoldin subunit 5
VNEEENDETVQNELDILRNRIESLKESISDAMNNCRTMRVRIQTRTQEVMVQIDQGFDQ